MDESCQDCGFKYIGELECAICSCKCTSDSIYEHTLVHGCKNQHLKPFRTLKFKSSEYEGKWFCKFCVEILIKTEVIDHSITKCLGCDQYCFSVEGCHICIAGGVIRTDGFVHFGYYSKYDLSIYDLGNMSPSEQVICNSCTAKHIEDKTFFKRHICSLCHFENSHVNAILDARIAKLLKITYINDTIHIVQPSAYSRGIDSTWKSAEVLLFEINTGSNLTNNAEICMQCLAQPEVLNFICTAPCSKCNLESPLLHTRYDIQTVLKHYCIYFESKNIYLCNKC